VSKRKDSAYRSGRSPDWIKNKNPAAQAVSGKLDRLSYVWPRRQRALFFQVVIDKVPVYHALSTLDVLIIGPVAIAIFETILGVLRTYLFAHTTNLESHGDLPSP
jgi:hypothetical protein